MVEGATPIARRPLTLALTLDRSGSMSGDPLRMAKQVALSLVDSLTEQDEVAVVIFDDKIETLQELARVTPAVKAQVRRELAPRRGARLDGAARGVAHELQDDRQRRSAGPARLARCYPLTDG